MEWVQQLISIGWNQESYPAFRDFSVLPFFALFFPSVRFLLDTFLFEVLTNDYTLFLTAKPILFYAQLHDQNSCLCAFILTIQLPPLTFTFLFLFEPAGEFVKVFDVLTL